MDAHQADPGYRSWTFTGRHVHRPPVAREETSHITSSDVAGNSKKVDALRGFPWTGGSPFPTLEFAGDGSVKIREQLCGDSPVESVLSPPLHRF